MIDIGANLANSQFNNDLEEVIASAIEHGVNSIILTSTKYDNYLKNLDIIDIFQKKHIKKLHLKTTYGLHPHYVEEWEIVFNNIQNIEKNKDIVAIGEFGLDYFRMLGKKELQIKVMNEFLNVAKNNTHLPLFLHEREAFQDFVSILQKHDTPNKKVVHCFTGNTKQVKKYLDLDCYIGITGWVTDNRRNSDLIEALHYIPIERIMIETDSPYLTPQMKNKPRRNEPKFLQYVLEAVSKIKKIPINETRHIINTNTINFFNLTFEKNLNYTNLNKKKY